MNIQFEDEYNTLLAGVLWGEPAVVSGASIGQWFLLCNKSSQYVCFHMKNEEP